MSARRAVRWTAHLRRRTTTGDWLPEIDGLRFLAIASVLLFHLQGQIEHHYTFAVRAPYTWLARAFDFGNRGVLLFFVLSGFILALPFARHHLFAAPRPPLRRYFLRRVTRLEPPYLMNLLLVACGAALAGHATWSLLPHLAASAAYLHYAVFRTPSTINSVAWSLEVEVQFYLLVPLLTSIFAVSSAEKRRALLFAAMLASFLFQGLFHLSQFTLAGELQYFLAGLLLADLYLTGRSSTGNSRTSTLWDLISLMGWPAFFLAGNRAVGLWLPALALLLSLAALRGNIVRRILRTPWIAIAGGMCYTIYLWHAPILTVADRALRRHLSLMPSTYPAFFVTSALIKTAAVALVCLPLFALVERPCMDPQWPQKFAAYWRRKHAPGALPAAPPKNARAHISAARLP